MFKETKREKKQDINADIFDIEAEKATKLTWSQSEANVLYSGSSDYSLIRNLKDGLLQLRQDFFSTNGGSQISISGSKR